MLFGAHFQDAWPLFPFGLLLLVAVVTDVTSYRIPNWISLSLVGLFLVAAAFSPEPVAWWSHLGAGLFSFVVGALLFVFRPLMGAGDVKLMAAVSLWMGIPALPVYLVLMSVCGAILGVGLWTIREILARWGPRFAKGREPLPVPRILMRHAEIPYGVAIVAAVVPMYLRFPIFWAS
jgi:prepilin peptidase CpaA